jgi:hypothetical protein
VRDITSHVCPYQGFLKNGKPGCLIHPLFINKDERNRSLFLHRYVISFYALLMRSYQWKKSKH